MQAWSPQEDRVILQMYQTEGRKWGRIASALPGRSSASVRNRFLRIKKGQTLRELGLSKNRCAACGQQKLGHVCQVKLSPLPVRPNLVANPSLLTLPQAFATPIPPSEAPFLDPRLPAVYVSPLQHPNSPPSYAAHTSFRFPADSSQQLWIAPAAAPSPLLPSMVPRGMSPPLSATATVSAGPTVGFGHARPDRAEPATKRKREGEADRVAGSAPATAPAVVAAEAAEGLAALFAENLPPPRGESGRARTAWQVSAGDGPPPIMRRNSSKSFDGLRRPLEPADNMLEDMMVAELAAQTA